MRISDWSSDVCSSDLVADRRTAGVGVGREEDVALLDVTLEVVQEVRDRQAELADDHLALGVPDQRELVVLLADTWRERGPEQQDRMSGESGKRVPVRVDLGGRRIIK